LYGGTVEIRGSARKFGCRRAFFEACETKGLSLCDLSHDRRRTPSLAVQELMSAKSNVTLQDL